MRTSRRGQTETNLIEPNGYAFVLMSLETFGRGGKLDTELNERAAGEAVENGAFTTNALRKLRA